MSIHFPTAERLLGAIVRIGNSENVLDNSLCPLPVSADQILGGQNIQVACNLPGRYLSVNLPGQGYLTLCEVRVYQGVCSGM
jgi:hypothetical protein